MGVSAWSVSLGLNMFDPSDLRLKLALYTLKSLTNSDLSLPIYQKLENQDGLHFIELFETQHG